MTTRLPSEMKTLADFKRALIPGEKWRMFNSVRNETTTRVVDQVKPTQVVFNLELDFTKPKRLSFLAWPKASDVTFINDGVSQKTKINFPSGDGYLIYERLSS